MSLRANQVRAFVRIQATIFLLPVQTIVASKVISIFNPCGSFYSYLFQTLLRKVMKLKILLLLSVAIGQRRRNYLSCCCCCCCSPFGSIPHLNKLKTFWLRLDSNRGPLTLQSITLPTELQRPWQLEVKKFP